MEHNHTHVICAFKESSYLEECIISLMNQTVKSKIIIFTSTPNETISNLAKKYEIDIYTRDGRGIGGDWNNALKCVTTQYATIVHQDDIYLPEYTSRVLIKFQQSNKYWITFTNYNEMRGNKIQSFNVNLCIKRILLFPLIILPNLRFVRWLSIAFGNPICCPAVTYNLNELKDFKFSEVMKVSLDWEAWYRIYKNDGHFGYVCKSSMLHRIHNESETTKLIADQTRTIEDSKMFQLLWPYSFGKLLSFFYKKSQDSN